MPRVVLRASTPRSGTPVSALHPTGIDRLPAARRPDHPGRGCTLPGRPQGSVVRSLRRGHCARIGSDLGCFWLGSEARFRQPLVRHRAVRGGLRFEAVPSGEEARGSVVPAPHGSSLRLPGALNIGTSGSAVRSEEALRIVRMGGPPREWPIKRCDLRVDHQSRRVRRAAHRRSGDILVDTRHRSGPRKPFLPLRTEGRSSTTTWPAGTKVGGFCVRRSPGPPPAAP